MFPLRILPDLLPAGTKAALNAALANKIKRVVITSSSAAVTHFPVPEGYVFTDKDVRLN